MILFDTHAHLDEEAFHPDQAETVQRAIDSGVETILTIGITAESSQRAVDLAATFPNVYAVVGIQPNYVAQMKPGDWELIKTLSTADKSWGLARLAWIATGIMPPSNYNRNFSANTFNSLESWISPLLFTVGKLKQTSFNYYSRKRKTALSKGSCTRFAAARKP